MEEIAISKFKATCLGVLERVRKTRRPVRVTRFGKPVAEVVPPSAPEKRVRRLGTMAGTVRILGDITSPASDESDWEALRVLRLRWGRSAWTAILRTGCSWRQRAYLT